MGYNIKKFRSVRHGVSEINAYCRHCSWVWTGSDAPVKAKNHAKKNLHTIDVYREHHTEYTSHVKENK